MSDKPSSISSRDIRNIAIIAHVDHGKTTLVDKLLSDSGTLGRAMKLEARVMDSNELEKERGITILSKNTGLRWNDVHINIVELRVMQILVERSKEFFQWSILFYFWLMQWKVLCHRPGLLRARHWRWG